ncbi:IS5/IS1182 family transposase, partial [Pseudomonas sp. MWU12-2534b]
MQVKIASRRNNGPLHPLVDSTGILFLGEGERNPKKHGPEYHLHW